MSSITSRPCRFIGKWCAAAVLGGCSMGNYSNPTLGVESARVTDRAAR